MRYFRRHANAFAQRRMRVNGFANVYGISAHLDGKCNLANHVARMCAHNAATQNLAVAMRFVGVVKQQLGETFVAAIGDGAS